MGAYEGCRNILKVFLTEAQTRYHKEIFMKIEQFSWLDDMLLAINFAEVYKHDITIHLMRSGWRKTVRGKLGFQIQGRTSQKQTQSENAEGLYSGRSAL